MNIVILTLSLVLFPWLPSVKAGEFDTEYACIKAAEAAQRSTPLVLASTCSVKT